MDSQKNEINSRKKKLTDVWKENGIEKNLGESVVTKTNKLNYKYIEEEESRNKLKLNDKNK